MGWPQDLYRKLSLQKSGGDNSSSSRGSVAAEQQERGQTEKKEQKRSCLFSCNAIVPRSMSKRSTASGNELVSAKEEDAGRSKRDGSNSSRRNSKRLKKNDKAALDSAIIGENDSDVKDGTGCSLCKASNATDAFVTGCGHVYCCGCLKDHVEREISSQMSTVQETIEHVLAQVLCPTASCGEELSRRELVDLLGPKPVRSYESWLVSVFDRFYRPCVKNARIYCLKEDRQNETVILTSDLQELSTPEVKKALQVRGADGTYLRQSCVRKLLKTVGVGEKEDRVVWLCISCDASWCAACGSQLSVIRTKSDRSKIHSNCKGIERFEIYKSLIKLEDAFELYTRTKQSPVKMGSKAAGGKTIWAVGTGYGGEVVESKQQAEAMQAAAKRIELEFDSEVEKQLAFLTGVLSRAVDSKNGETPPLTLATCALIGRENILSRLLQQLATNDSMLDIAERGGLYLKMVSLLGAIQSHRELRPLLSGDLGHDTASEQEVSAGEPGLGSTSPVDKDNTIFAKMGNIYRQAKVMLQNMPQSDRDRGRRKAVDGETSLARELCRCYESLEEAVLKQDVPPAVDSNCTSAIQTKGVTTRSMAKKAASVKAAPKLELTAANYKEVLKKLQFRQLSMTDLKGEYSHAFKDHIMGKVAGSASIDKRGAHNHKRMIHLSKEIASLATTLPLEWESSIHLCVDESRMDVMRALIIGPQGTPYQNGLFFFDIFLPPDYPQVPPLVHFLTTGGGRVRFNPNLYDSGKICLSLLGTWSGPGWTPGKSTLLQVLVSIQSLIFVKDPYYNEPGYESRTSPESEKENSRHRENTLSLAVLAALRKPDPLFADIAFEHFRFKRQEVESQCDEWMAAAPDGTACRQRIANIAEDVKAEFQSLRDLCDDQITE